MRPDRSPADRIALVVATGLGSGYAPVAPGTFGSIPGLAIAWILSRTGGAPALAAGTALVALVGIWAADRAEKIFGGKDPGRVVIDEIAGQMLTMLFVPFTGPLAAAGFFLFRAADVIKPFPARRLESLDGGSGIMADDLVAGLYANLCLQAAAAWLPPAYTGVLGA